ncbi:MAG: type II toxin-antitoxin system HicA family toxin [Chloroflexota bacterium]|nr:MAG: type II toxin-antitoxin system HicA family toxin [Chloroflexota bacterium]
MPAFAPIKRADLVRYLRKAGFDGPYPQSKHEIMRHGSIRVVIPNPHEGDIGVGFLHRILREAGITREEWEAL